MICARENVESRFNCTFSTILTNVRLNYGAWNETETRQYWMQHSEVQWTKAKQTEIKLENRHLNSADFHCINYMLSVQAIGIGCWFTVRVRVFYCHMHCFWMPMAFACRNRIDSNVKCRCPWNWSTSFAVLPLPTPYTFYVHCRRLSMAATKKFVRAIVESAGLRHTRQV